MFIDTKNWTWNPAELAVRTAWPEGPEVDVLRLLRDEFHSASSLEIVAKSQGRVGRCLVYTLLGRLEEKGFVGVTEIDDGEHLLPKPMYSITTLGVNKLKAVNRE